MKFMEVSRDQFIRYIERRKKEIVFCRGCLLQKNYDQISLIGHKLSGNAKTFGLPNLAKLGAALEKSAHMKDSVQINRQLNQISVIINSIH
jgi:HPt (histidine-containing phosphotransfer) domain-containing protein